MADDNESPLRPRTSLPRAAPRYTSPSTSRSGQSQGQSHANSFETGESSAAAAAAAASSSSSSRHSPDRPFDDPEHAAPRRLSHKPRPTGGFLLPNPVHPPDPPRRAHGHSPVRDGARRHSRIPVDSSRKGKSPAAAPRADRRASLSPAGRQTPVDVADGDGYAAPREARPRTYNPRPASNSRIPSPSPEPAAPDMDATQIVNMALNLSESRRLAQRRHVSHPVPPRLTPLPDSAANAGLKHHLQQQRRTSRAMSPMADTGGPVLRNVSAASARVNSPLQTAFESEGGYTYHFSSSTLNRAQKAKEYIELMAQYRRLIDLLPPLRPEAPRDGRTSTSSPPASPASATFPQSPSHSHSHSHVALGREYNPLQYIRNRKVRARERQVMDGEAQGFADVSKVAHWIDQAAASAAISAVQPDVPAVPTFPGAHLAPTQQMSASSHIPVPVSGTAKPKRPRMDWAIDPADMLADVYWVEQDDNKSLIEDRHYTRLFPRKPVVSSGQPPEDAAAEPRMSLDKKEPGHYSDTSEDHRSSDPNAASKIDTEASHISARDRARQKLQELRGIHHKHNSSAHSHHDLLNFRRSSFSDTSDSEVDRRKRDRSGTISAKDQAVLEKQMNAMMAQEAMDNHRASLDSIQQGPQEPFRPTLMTPDRVPEPAPASVDSRAEDGDLFDTLKRGRARPGSPIRHGRDSLDVPDYHGRSSLDVDSSVPTSPELKPKKRRSYQLYGAGVDPSPNNSRPGSPVRNPFAKIKNKFRDRSRERPREPPLNHVDAVKEERPQSPSESGEQQALSPISAEGRDSPERRRSKSPGWKLPSRNTGDSGHKGHRSMGSLRLGRDDQIGLRSIFKGGVKIDGIIRGGVSKVSDMIWKKDHDEEGGSSSSSDESESEESRGRAGTRPSLSRTHSPSPPADRQAKHYLDSMPAFESVLDAEKASQDEPGTFIVPVDPPSSPHHRRSKRFDQLKPPRIDIMSASPPGRSPVLQPVEGAAPDTDVSDIESTKRDSAVVATQSARNSSSQLNAVLSLPPPSSRPHRNSLAKSQRWSITDASLLPPHSPQLSRREVARLRALVVCSGIRAMEIARRSEAAYPLSSLESGGTGLSWGDIAGFAAADGGNLTVSQKDVFPATARILASSIESSNSTLQGQMQAFAQNDMRRLHGRVDALHAQVARDLAEMARRATDDADECSRDINDGQRLKVKHVMDVIDKMTRQRRRRFRWARRAGWLMVEWALVGFMWYVWFLVMIARIFLGVGRGAVGAVRWLLWL